MKKKKNLLRTFTFAITFFVLLILSKDDLTLPRISYLLLGASSITGIIFDIKDLLGL